MLSAVDLERLIAAKRHDIKKEKTFLGLSSADCNREDAQNNTLKPRRSVSFSHRDLSDYNVQSTEEKKDGDGDTREEIPADLERYIRRYLGLPVMLKAGEYSPNNPLVRGERTSGDVLLGLGEYERRRNTLRKLRQQQYREYLDQQAKKKQEAKEQADKERREREEKEREREEREREKDREEREKERVKKEREREEWDREREERERRRESERNSPDRRRASENLGVLSYSKVDTGVQVDRRTAPLSVAVQTEDADLFRLSPSPSISQLTQAERELSPRTADDRAVHPAPWSLQQDRWKADRAERRRSYGDFDERSSSVQKSNRDKLSSDLRHSYMPSIFDADAIQLRNMQAEKEAAARRQFYQQELKNQIMEQQRIREERKTREKMLEAAEMRRLEEQLRMLRAARGCERERRHHRERAIKEDNIEYDKKRKELQRDIDEEQIKLIRAPLTTQPQKRAPLSRDNEKLPFYYPLLQDRNREQSLFQQRTSENTYFQDRNKEFQERSKDSPLLQETINDRKPFSTNIPNDSIFSPNYDVDGYLRRNLNFKAFELKNNYDSESVGTEQRVEKVLVHELPKVKPLDRIKPIPKERKMIPQDSIDSLPIPVLRHSPVSQQDRVENGSELSDAMKQVDDKWKVPVVQKNILKSMPNDEGKNVSILTQLGSIRRQLQLEQLKLDRLSKDDDI